MRFVPEAKPSGSAQRRRGARHAVRAIAMVWQASRTLTGSLAALTLVAALAPPSIAWVGKRIVDAVVAHSSPQTLRWVLVELALVAAQALVERSLGLVGDLLALRLSNHVNLAILDKAVSLRLADFEDSEFYDRMTRARREASTRPMQLVKASFSLVQSVIMLVGYAALLVRFSPWVVVVLLVATIPATVAEMKTSKQAFQMRNRRSPEWRRLTYLEYVLTTDGYAKEVKLFALGPPLISRYRALAEKLLRDDRSLAIRRTLGQLLSLIATVAFYAAYLVMALAAAAGRISLGSMTLYVIAFRQGQSAFQSVLGAIGSIYENNLYMSNLFEFLGVAGDETPVVPALPDGSASPARESEPAAPLASGLEFQHVSFRYPGKQAWALQDVSLVVPRGTSLALVGENGAGKTTIVKLLTRLYEPTDGRILLDGKDLRDWDGEALRTRFGVVFQDFSHYQLPARDNVGMGDVAHLEDETKIVRAAEEGGASEVIAALPRGLDTQLGNWFVGGTELSGGQWQKIALARAFMREQADVLVLDEPTASLDAEAEHRVFERFSALARGRTTIIISHRFPTVRMANRIVVLEHGRVIEQGTHADLLAMHGRYAHMFELQAEGYR